MKTLVVYNKACDIIEIWKIQITKIKRFQPLWLL